MTPEQELALAALVVRALKWLSAAAFAATLGLLSMRLAEVLGGEWRTKIKLAGSALLICLPLWGGAQHWFRKARAKQISTMASTKPREFPPLPIDAAKILTALFDGFPSWMNEKSLRAKLNLTAPVVRLSLDHLTAQEFVDGPRYRLQMIVIEPTDPPFNDSAGWSYTINTNGVQYVIANGLRA